MAVICQRKAILLQRCTHMIDVTLICHFTSHTNNLGVGWGLGVKWRYMVHGLIATLLARTI